MRLQKKEKTPLGRVDVLRLPTAADIPPPPIEIADDPLRSAIIALGALGTTEEEIALITGLTNKQVRKFATDTSAAAALANARVAQVAFQMAISGDSPKATQSWLKAKAGWKEDGVAINNNLVINWPLPPHPLEVNHPQAQPNTKQPALIDQDPP